LYGCFCTYRERCICMFWFVAEILSGISTSLQVLIGLPLLQFFWHLASFVQRYMRLTVMSFFLVALPISTVFPFFYFTGSVCTCCAIHLFNANWGFMILSFQMALKWTGHLWIVPVYLYITDFGIAELEKDIGYYTGYVSELVFLVLDLRWRALCMITDEMFFAKTFYTCVKGPRLCLGEL
jgi:hypothetical protein